MPGPDRIGALWCPNWAVISARARYEPGHPARDHPLLAIVEKGPRGPVVRGVSPAAREAGVTVGLRRREAEARCAGLEVVDADDAADARVFEPVVRAVEQLVPLLVVERPGRLSFPTRGPSRYFGGDEALAQRVREAVRDVGVPDVRVGVADGELAAALAARSDCVVPPGESRRFLAPLSVGVLAARVDGGPELVDLLGRLGLRTLGDFAALPVAAVLGRFGIPGATAHRLARGESEHELVPLPVPPELIETIELDPPATRVDEAAFAAKTLADRLFAHLDRLGVCTDRVMIEAETEHGERLTRCWRHEGALTPSTLATRVRWQLEAWLNPSSARARGEPGDLARDGWPLAGLTMLRLAPDGVTPATGRQLGFWGGDAAAGDRAARTLARVQGMLGQDAVVTALAVGGRTPAEQVRWVPWGEPREVPVLTPPDAPWAGAVPGPPPARVFDPPLPAALVDADGDTVTVSGRGEQSAVPAALQCSALPGGGGVVTGWAGPWAHDVRWWDRRRRRVLWQIVVAGPDGTDVACLVSLTRGRAALDAVYD